MAFKSGLFFWLYQYRIVSSNKITKVMYVGGTLKEAMW